MTEEKSPIGEMPINLTFSVNRTNEILQALACLPFGQVAMFIKDIQDQAIPQAKVHEDAVKNAAKEGEIV